MRHGGDLISYKKYYEGELIDFSSNINPLGFPEGLEKELINSLSHMTSYPDIKYRCLKSSISKYLNCDMENVVVGNGAVDIIDNFTQIYPRIIVILPSFSEYEERALIHNKEVIRLKYKEDFTIDLDSIEKVVNHKALLVLGNPNNPTGLRIERETLIKLYEIVKQKEGYLLLDEAFYEFCPVDYDSIEIFKKDSYKNIGIIRAATKFFGLPGIRLGYACVSKDIKEKYEKVELPWSVNALADRVGRYIFKCKDYIKKSQDYMERERNFLLGRLAKIQGIRPYPTHSNYILIKLLKWKEDYVFEFFLKRGLIIRKCSSFNGLDNTYIRVAIKDRNSNIKLIETFKELEEII
ncbi:pyridoxal phosphate-dependent aminotransferase [Tepidimicrobium xylanilyticum]|uniref:Threonine-phosphate decarboxylase n=1 Tax=Tepidimicrobium xylanilyticum TaxID=1123352 RepID=A0A1H2TIW0_9FIRM|nr:histidinol-phosphate transaminase [Tepidimicrobium xylanilyticum]GMG95936.1 aspartate aminotransferase [Tepidimicrobium xylanilyticum]SDW43625.1 threonine-phosphate decarboxylase [Tepidimicrobium xylanilyticum]